MSNIRPEYKTPEVVTYRDSEILKQIGPLRGTTDLPAPTNFNGFSTTGSEGRKRYRGILQSSLLEDDE